jgi:WD40 repeat protein
MQVKVVDILKGRLVYVSESQRNSPCRIAMFSPNGQYLAASGGQAVDNDASVGIWDTASWKLMWRSTPQRGASRRILTSAIFWSQDERVITATGADNAIHWWDAQTGAQLDRCSGHLRHVSQIRYWPEGDIAASLAEGGAVHLWKPSTGEPLRTFVFLNGLEPVAINPQGHYLADRGVDKELVYVVEKEGGEQLTLTPAEFAKRYGWKNDPQKVLTGLGAK